MYARRQGRGGARLLDEDLVALAAMLDVMGDELYRRFHCVGEREKRPGSLTSVMRMGAKTTMGG